jgi:hypothetical protein
VLSLLPRGMRASLTTGQTLSRWAEPATRRAAGQRTCYIHRSSSVTARTSAVVMAPIQVRFSLECQMVGRSRTLTVAALCRSYASLLRHIGLTTMSAPLRSATVALNSTAVPHQTLLVSFALSREQSRPRQWRCCASSHNEFDSFHLHMPEPAGLPSSALQTHCENFRRDAHSLRAASKRV